MQKWQRHGSRCLLRAVVPLVREGLSEHAYDLTRKCWPKWREVKHLPQEEV